MIVVNAPKEVNGVNVVSAPNAALTVVTALSVNRVLHANLVHPMCLPK